MTTAIIGVGLITAAGFDPVQAGGVKDAWRLELPGGDLHQYGGLNGKLLDLDEARAAVGAAPLREDGSQVRRAG